ncbi:MAG: molybdopterin-dependent oxidoreductase, partial [Deltaproteobacteria bacterium]|nr:molybdopterin-dependent oxidoreductase [Deltaproteobacteria bacterium]
KRVGARGAGQWEPLTWEEALRTLADRLRGLREQGEAHTLVVLTERPRGVMPDLLRRFARAFGTPNVIDASGDDPSSQALWLTQGIGAPIAYDLENAKYIVSFGVPLVDGWWAPVRQMRALVQVRQGTPGRRGKLVQVEPRLSPSAAKADEWIPMNPGTEGALALGLAHVLVAEGLFDRRFVAERTFGFEDWVDESGRTNTGFRSLLIKEYLPSKVAKVTGVPEETIRRLARELAASGPGVALGPAGGQSNDRETAWAIHALNALMGAIERPGGALVARTAPLAQWPEVRPDETARRSLAMPKLPGARGDEPLAGNSFALLADALRSGAPYRAKALLLWGANPAFTEPGPGRVRQALSEIPFVVSVSSFLDESTQYADLVLPGHMFLEAWHDDPPPAGVPYPVVGVAQPAVEPPYQTRHAGDVILSLAQALGGRVAEAFPWKEFKDVLMASMEGLYRSRRGMIFAKQEESGPPRPLREWEWAPLPYKSFKEFWEDLVNKGGWIDPSYRYGEWTRVFQTPSGKFEFYSRTLRRAVEARARAQGKTPEKSLAVLGLAASKDQAFLPHYEPPRLAGDEGSYPLTLVTFQLLTLGDGSLADLPFLQERLAPHANVQWGTWVEINPKTAGTLGVHDGDWVWVESSVGKVKVRARLYPGIAPGVAAIPMGQGHTALGRYARGVGANPMELLGAERDPLSGTPALATRVKVSKA